MQDLQRVDYEFECEALADFKFSQGTGLTNRETEERFVRELELGERNDQMTVDEALKFVQPKIFVKGRNMYSQVKDPLLNLKFFTESIAL